MRNKHWLIGIILFSTHFGFAEDTRNANVTTCPPNGFFTGLGGSYNSVNLTEFLSGVGVSDVYQGSTLVATGTAGGPATPFRDTKSTFAPEGQFGYFHHLKNSAWFLGGKFFYQYLGLTFTNGPVDAFQAGVFTTASGDSAFIGNAFVQSSQVLVNHELVLMPFVGRSFKRTHAYLGAGPVVFQTDSYQYNFIGFANINGVHTDVTGQPATLKNSQWMWGGGAQVGAMHYFNAHWFLDFSYTFLVTAYYTFHDSESFTSTTRNGTTVYTNVGTAFIESKQRVIAQGVALSFNYLF